MSNPDSTISELSASASPRHENLALLYQGILTAIVRVQSGRQQLGDSNAFRKGMQDMLGQVTRKAARAGYEPADVADSSLAVAAFLDEALHNSTNPGRMQWRPLQAEMCEEAGSGEVFFHRLNTLKARRDSVVLSDVLEVYNLCLLLGYRGCYSGEGGAGEISRATKELGKRIRLIRGSTELLSPSAIPPGSGRTVSASIGRNRRWLWPTAAGAFGVVVWISLRLMLYLQGSAISDAIEKWAH